MDLRLYPGKLSGVVTPPPSKSIAHRVLFASALAGDVRAIEPWMTGDVRVTAEALRDLRDGREVLECGESGTTLRFLLPLVMTLPQPARLRGSARLLTRPLPPYAALTRMGDELCVENRLAPGVFALRGDVSSQFISGLLFALPLLPHDSRIVFTTPPQSRPYLTMTRGVLRAFGVTSEEAEDGYLVPGGQRYHPADYPMEGDWSAAAVYFAANALGSRVSVHGLAPASLQGDRAIEALAASLPAVIDAGDIPDLVPTLAALAACTPGRATHIVRAARLRGKESDRLATITAALRALGGHVTETDDGLIIEGQAVLRGGVADAANDHRIAMLLAVAATCCDSPVTVRGAECVEKSYAALWRDLRALGLRIEEA